MANEQRQIPASISCTTRLAVAVYFFLTGVTFASWAVRIPTVQTKLGLNPGELGVTLLGTATGELVSMNLAARFGSGSLAVIASVCPSVMLPILALAPSLPVLMAALLLFGASFSLVNVAMNTQGVAVERRYGRSIFNSFHACYSLGRLTGSLVGGLVAVLTIAPLPHFLGIALIAIILALSLAPHLVLAQADAQGAGVALARLTPTLLALGLVAFCTMRAEVMQAVQAAMQALPHAQRQVVTLCYQEGLLQREAAEQLGYPLGTVKCHLHRAMRTLRKRLEAQGVGAGDIRWLMETASSYHGWWEEGVR